MSQDELTKSQLYSIYDSSELENENDMNVLYSNLGENIIKSENIIKTESSVDHTKKRNIIISFVLTIVKLLILAVLGNLYHLLSVNIHDNHILVKDLASKPLNIGVLITNNLFQTELPNQLIYGVEGILFGLILPIFDKFFTPANQKTSRMFMDSSKLIRSLVAFLGISFAIRKIEWNSSIQASITWCLINPILWILVDGTISSFLSGFIIASIASISFIIFDSGLPNDWIHNTEFWAILLWLGNFFFFGLIVFGKVGRYLFD